MKSNKKHAGAGRLMQEEAPIGFKVIQSTLGGKHNLGVTSGTQQASNSEDRWRLVGSYTNKKPVKIADHTVSQIGQPSNANYELLPFEISQRVKRIPDHFLLPDQTDIKVGDEDDNYGYMCNESAWPNTLFAVKFNKHGYDFTNVLLYRAPNTSDEEELFTHYSEVFEDDTTLNNLRAGHPPSERELKKYIEWLESDKFHFGKGGDLEGYTEKNRARKYHDIMIKTFDSADTPGKKDRVMNAYLSSDLKHIKVKHLLTNTWLNLYLHEYFTLHKKESVLQNLNRLHQIEPWSSCYKSDSEAIAKVKSFDEYKELILGRKFNDLYRNIFQFSNKVQGKKNQGTVFEADLSSVEVVLNLDKMREHLTLLHPRILEHDTRENYSKKLKYVVMLCDVIEKSITTGRYDHRAYSIELLQLLKSITEKKYYEVDIYQVASRKVNDLLGLMSKKNFHGCNLAEYLASVIGSHYKTLSDELIPINSRINIGMLVDRMKKIGDFVTNMNETSIERQYSQVKNSGVVGSALSRQSLFTKKTRKEPQTGNGLFGAKKGFLNSKKGNVRNESGAESLRTLEQEASEQKKGQSSPVTKRDPEVGRGRMNESSKATVRSQESKCKKKKGSTLKRGFLL